MRTTAIAVIAAAVLALATGGAIALAGWCWSDPVIGFNTPGLENADVHVDVGVPEEYRAHVQSVKIVVTHPFNVKPRIKFKDDILPEEVVFVPTPIPWEKHEDLEIGISVFVAGLAPGGDSFERRWGSLKPFPVAYQVKHRGKSGKDHVKVVEGFSMQFLRSQASVPSD